MLKMTSCVLFVYFFEVYECFAVPQSKIAPHRHSKICKPVKNHVPAAGLVCHLSKWNNYIFMHFIVMRGNVTEYYFFLCLDGGCCDFQNVYLLYIVSGANSLLVFANFCQLQHCWSNRYFASNASWCEVARRADAACVARPQICSFHRLGAPCTILGCAPVP